MSASRKNVVEISECSETSIASNFDPPKAENRGIEDLAVMVIKCTFNSCLKIV